LSKELGIEKEDEYDAPYKIIQYEGWLELPTFDQPRYCQVIWDYVSMRPLCLRVHEEPYWKDKLRYDQQAKELEMYNAALSEWQGEEAELAEQQQAIEQSVMAGETSFTTYEAAQANAPRLHRPPPPPPSWAHVGEDGRPGMPEAPKRVPLHLFAHGVCIEPLVGTLGLGYGRMQADYTRAANTLWGQFIDAATLANCGMIVTSPTVEFDGGFRVGPGKHLKARGMTGMDVSQNIMQLKLGSANQQLSEAAQQWYEYGQSVAQAPDVLSGESGKSGEPFKALQMRIDQAIKQISVPARKICNVLEQVLRNNAYLNSVFLPEEEMVQLLNHLAGRYQPTVIRREMYDRNYRVQIRADLRFSSQSQRIAEADELVSASAPNGPIPELAANPRFRYEAIKRSLEARNRHDLAQLLGKPPDPPETFVPPPPPMAMGPNGQPIPVGAPPGAPPGGPPGPPQGGPPPGAPPIPQ
jgi:hypothetical protein